MNLAQRFALSTFLVVFSLYQSATLAHAEFRIVVSPPSTDVTANPGEVIQKTIKVTNNGDDSVTLSANISDFIVQDDQGTPVKVSSEASGRYFAKPWIQLSDTTLTLNSQETKEVVVIIDVPKDALPGGHYAGIFFSPKDLNKPKGTGAAVMPEVGSLFAITVPGNLTYDATITKFTTNGSFFEFGPINFEAVVENQSDTHISPAPVIEVKDMLGRSLSKIELSKTNIFPFTARSFQGTWDQVWGFGRYSAHLTVPYGVSHAATRVLYFWIIPYRLVAAILVVVLVILAIIVLLNRRKKHLEDQRDQEIEALKRRIIELENR